ncbi:hypothetical protein [Pelagovum pacificum]|uniref:Uncharacterized protein n=1 Tax=Pelagovum pacificum TaxID=2588711 RepID=A0A5C5GBM4_9RHOB|nr:hypothetical protein [Pelagovum pacificum]QQA44685.1 hypothetical protein I8N54_08995 [Pelagovum pacificum]TNY32205.1 hypothetical protein FHY64_02600 [Pelagovum pacificum]
MSFSEEVANRLAEDVIQVMEKLGEPRLHEEIAKSLGASSQTTEEAFRTAIRVLLAERRARDLLREIEQKGGLEE